ncbi:MAG TPA: nitrate- and nitrite sensing domain-containing protein [Micromonospora sp.]|nr:nitrate- and nitrite sensing domain-containing protein [Micromonospora sp.]
MPVGLPAHRHSSAVYACWFLRAAHDWIDLAQRQADRAGAQPEAVSDQPAATMRRPEVENPGRLWRWLGPKGSIKRRVLRLVLSPSIVSVVLCFGAAVYLVGQGFYNREVAQSVRTVSIPAVRAMASIQQERQLSVAHLAQPSGDRRELLDQRQQTDQRLSALRAVGDSAMARAPQSIKSRWQTLTDHVDQLSSVRSAIDSRSDNGQQAYDFYSDLLDAATSLFDTQARIVPDGEAASGGIVATEVFRASDQMSRAASTIDGAFGSRRLSAQEHLQFVSLVGAYRSSLANAAPHLRPEARKRYESLTASDAWRQLVAAENALIAGGAWRGVPSSLPANEARWETLTRQVSDELTNLTITQADEVSAVTLRTGNVQLLIASLGSLLALAIAITAIGWAVRRSRVLVDEGLAARLARLGEDATAVVDQRLPDMMKRLRLREKVDLAVELPAKDYGRDEIGQLADVINRSMKAAAGAAVDEANARAAGVTMLMGVARRPGRPLQRAIQSVERLQTRVTDEGVMADLFDIHHQLAQGRRFMENLQILAGSQIGRRFQSPRPMRAVLQAARAETQNYERITVRGAPDVALVGPAVPGTIHLLAELLDNALAFSRPESPVWLTCSEVNNGVAVEIEDAGVGMTPDALERANEMLATAPTPDVTALKDGSQIGLYVVAELAKRDGIRVSLRTSAYGGLLAVVLLPSRIIVADQAPAGRGTDSAKVDAHLLAGSAPMPDSAGRHPLRAAAVPTSAGVAVATRSVQTQRSLRTGPDRRSDHIPPQPESPRAPAVGTGSPAARPPLPHRRPQEHLVPALRDDNPSATDIQRVMRSPEEARDRFARYQRGRDAGRTAGNDETTTKDD